MIGDCKLRFIPKFFRNVTFLPDCVGREIESYTSNPHPGEIILLENLRFHIEEEGKGKNEANETVRLKF